METDDKRCVLRALDDGRTVDEVASAEPRLDRAEIESLAEGAAGLRELARLADDEDMALGGGPVVVSTPWIMGGEPCFRGTLVPRDTVDAELAAGFGIDKILTGYPTLDRADLVAYVDAIAYLKADRARCDEFNAWLDSLVEGEPNVGVRPHFE